MGGKRAAFTLAELVTAMVILAAAGAASASFLWRGAKIYAGAGARVQLAAAAHNLVMRLAIQIESALPYSVSARSAAGASGPALSFTVPVSAYRVADTDGAGTVILNLGDGDPLCGAGAGGYELRYLRPDRSYGRLGVAAAAPAREGAAGGTCAAGPYRVTLAGWAGAPLRSGTVLYLTDGNGEVSYRADGAGRLLCRRGGAETALNNPRPGEHGVRVDLFKIDDGTARERQNAVTLTLALSAEDESVAVSHRVEIRANAEYE